MICSTSATILKHYNSYNKTITRTIIRTILITTNSKVYNVIHLHWRPSIFNKYIRQTAINTTRITILLMNIILAKIINTTYKNYYRIRILSLE